MFQRFQGQFPLRYMKHGSSWSVFLSAASYCIWQVEISYPIPCPRTQSINNPLKFHGDFILNFTIANTVISKKSYFRLNIWWDVIYVQREQQGTKNGALGDTRQNRSPVRFYSIYNNPLLSEAKKRIYPFQCLATSSIAKQFAFKEFMMGSIKCLFKFQYVSTCPLLSKILAQSFMTVVNWVSQLCPFLNACCLSDRSLYSSRWASGGGRGLEEIKRGSEIFLAWWDLDRPSG